MNERLSAFLDGEATRDESDSVVNALLRDDELRDSWTRQHWIRTTLRAHNAEPSVAVDTDFSSRVMQAIAEDDHRDTIAPASNPSNVVPMTRRVRTRRWRGVAGFAAAASVAGVVLMTGNPFVRNGAPSDSRLASTDNTGTNSSLQTTDTTQERQNSGFGEGSWDSRLADFSSVSAQTARVQTVSTGRAAASGQRGRGNDADAAGHWSVSDPAVRSELNGYLVDHNGMSRGYGVSGTTPGLVRVATYGQGSAQ